MFYTGIVANNNEKLMERLYATALRGTVSHAYLFCGERGAGKRAVALQLAGRLVGVPEDRLAAHPDVVLVERKIVDDKEKEISVSDVRALRSRLSLTSATGGWKVAIMECVERLEKEAANALLKTLEEPRGKTVIIMTTERPAAVLPTIRSRATRISFAPSSTDDPEITKEERAEYERVLAEMHAAPYAARFRWSEKISKDAGKPQRFLRFAAGKCQEAFAANHASGTAPSAKTAARAKAILFADALLTNTNASVRLALDVFLLKL